MSEAMTKQLKQAITDIDAMLDEKYDSRLLNIRFRLQGIVFAEWVMGGAEETLERFRKIPTNPATPGMMEAAND